MLIDFNGIFGINMANKMGINMGNHFLGINIGNMFFGLIWETFSSFLVSRQVRVACRGGLRRKILVKNDLLQIECAFFDKNVLSNILINSD